MSKNVVLCYFSTRYPSGIPGERERERERVWGREIAGEANSAKPTGPIGPSGIPGEREREWGREIAGERESGEEREREREGNNGRGRERDEGSEQEESARTKSLELVC